MIDRNDVKITDILGLIKKDRWRKTVLLELARFDDPRLWIGAGFIRNLVWDHLHDRDAVPPDDDVDILYFDDNYLDPKRNNDIVDALMIQAPSIPWSVRNQARMHLRNGDRPYESMGDALAHWLETPTSVCVRLDQKGQFFLYATYGLDDLSKMILRPTPSGYERIETLRARAHNKGWLERWPSVVFLDQEKPICQPTHLEEMIDYGPEFWNEITFSKNTASDS